MKVFACIIITMVSLALVSTVCARQLFWDDFEADALGAEPSKWKNLGLGAGGGGEIVPDPKNAKNKVFSMPDRFVPAARDNGAFYMIGNDSWTDYIAEWDWMPSDGYHGMNFRFQAEEEYYLIDKRGAEGVVHIYTREPGVWTQFSQGPWLWKAGVWYRVHLEAQGDTFVFKWKELGDDTSFDEIDAAEAGLTAQNDKYKSGGITNGGLGLIDNMVVGETEGDLALGVESEEKLPVAWAKLKKL